MIDFLRSVVIYYFTVLGFGVPSTPSFGSGGTTSPFTARGFNANQPQQTTGFGTAFGNNAGFGIRPQSPATNLGGGIGNTTSPFGKATAFGQTTGVGTTAFGSTTFSNQPLQQQQQSNIVSMYLTYFAFFLIE